MASKVYFTRVKLIIQTTFLFFMMACTAQNNSKLDLIKLFKESLIKSDFSSYLDGKKAAKKDIKKKVYYYLTWGTMDDRNACFKANMSQLGIHINYFEDDVADADNSFILGYNEVALAYWKKKLGDAEYKKRFEDSEKVFNPLEKLNENLLILNEFYDFSFINDSSANVKIDTKAILDEYAQNVVYTLKSSKDETSEKTMSTTELAQDGYTFKFPKNCSRVHLRISINLKEIYEEQPICNCIPEEVIYHYTMPFNRK